jgi:prephenate dehydratase
MKIASLGPKFTWSHIHASNIFETADTIVLKDSFDDLFDMLINDNDVDAIFVPIENIITGSLRPIWSHLISGKYAFKKVYQCKIDHVLCSKELNHKVKRIFGHVEALTQCSNYIKENYSDCKLIPTSSTTSSVTKSNFDNGCAVICSQSAANYYNLNVLDENISDKDNYTRFALVTKTDKIQHDFSNSHTSIYCTLENVTGSLYEFIRVIAESNCNMTRIESIPSGLNFAEFSFLIDFEGKFSEEKYKKLQNKANEIDILGNYSIEKTP